MCQHSDLTDKAAPILNGHEPAKSLGVGDSRF